ncbi:unnamed protein product [Oikopleura dioica]|uniref:Uncharacterized protein n=1 Tax=Oikopleura dioica TaxID=34765 RepID=E4XED4_OIKDI|nr:unnamed protein product [Oikopleura dioica]
MSDFDDPSELAEWRTLLDNNQLTPEIRKNLECTDRRMNGQCRCIQKSILSVSPLRRSENLRELVRLIGEARRLKNIRQEDGDVENGRRYSKAYIAFVEDTDANLMSMRLCKKAIVKILRCSLNFLYQRKNTPKARRTPLSTSKLRGTLYYDMREHVTNPCDNAIREIVQLSKATINNLRTKSRNEGVPHGAHGKKKSVSGGSTGELFSPATPLTPGAALSTPACLPATSAHPVFEHHPVKNFKLPPSPKFRSHFSFDHQNIFLASSFSSPSSHSPLPFFCSQLSPSPFLGTHEIPYLGHHFYQPSIANFPPRERLEAIKAEPQEKTRNFESEDNEENFEKNKALKSPTIFAQLTIPKITQEEKPKTSPPEVPIIKITPPFPKRSRKGRPLPELDLINPKKSLQNEESMTQTPTMVPKTPSRVKAQTPSRNADSSIFFPSH